MFRASVVWLVGLSALAIIGCSSDADDTLTVTPPGVTTDPTMAVISPTATAQRLPPTETPSPVGRPTPPTRTGVTATPAVTPTGVVQPPPGPIIDLATLTVPVCRTTPSSSSGSGFGTVPHATPTPVPASGGTGQSSSVEATAFVAGMKPLYGALRSAIVAGDEARARAGSAQELAAPIMFEGRRLSHICSALSIVPGTSASGPLFSQIARSLKAHRDSLFEQAELLRESGVGLSNHERESERTDSDILALGSVLDTFAEEAGVEESAGSEGYTIVNPLLELSLDVAPGWVTARNGVDVFVIAPPGVQRYSVSGLGPDAWRLGTALRVRRFRNETDRTLEEATATVESLMVRFGNRVDEVQSAVGGQLGVRLTYADDAGRWRTLVGTTVVADATYLFEIGCPLEFLAECEVALDALLTGVSFDEG